MGPTPLRVLDFSGDPGDETTYSEAEYAEPQFSELDDAPADPIFSTLEEAQAVNAAAEGDEEEPEVSLADIIQMLYEGIAELVDAANDLDRRLTEVENRPTFAQTIRSRRTGV